MKDFSRVGRVYINNQNNVAFDFNNIHIEILGMANLKEILSVSCYEKDGYIVLDTNYGEEPFELGAVIEDLHLGSYIDIEKELRNIETFVILRRRDMKSVEELRDKAFMIMSDIALFSKKTSNALMLVAIDLKNPKNRAELIYREDIKGFSIVDSTFPENKRKYEMLYLIERNKSQVYRGLTNG